MLTLKSLEVAYGGVPALRGITLQVPSDGFIAIVGPNGAGKTTLFKAISGTVEAHGTLEFEGVDLHATPASRRAALGIAHVPEGRQVFPTMTVGANLEMGGYVLGRQPRRKQAMDMVLQLFPRLAQRRDQLAGTLSGGEQQMLAIGRALASAPRLLMLDEPSMGLAPAVVDNMFASIARIHAESGIGVLLVEQRAVEALELCTTGHVLETGQLVLSGPPQVLLADDSIKRAYLGT